MTLFKVIAIIRSVGTNKSVIKKLLLGVFACVNEKFEVISSLLLFFNI